MKSLVLSIVFLFASHAFSQTVKTLLETQTSIVIEEIDQSGNDYCLVTKFSLNQSEDGKVFWNTHVYKPLPFNVAQKVGISFALRNGHDCPVRKGQVVDGVLALFENGIISFD